ncbi:MAG: slipin family protein [Spirochaetales bacterium]|nr:slipin family protein [Spirochaetales bacterium]
MIIKKDERGLLFRDGDYVKVLKPGKYPFFWTARYKVEVLDVNKPFKTEKDISLFLEDEELLKELDIIDVKDNEFALYYQDGKFRGVYSPGKYAFWKVFHKNSFKIIDKNKAEIDEDIELSLLHKGDFSGLFIFFEICNFEKGLLFYNNKFQKILEPGKYYFWNNNISVSMIKADLRRQQLDVAGQEIMTEDKVTLRLNFVCHYRIIDPVKALLEIKEYQVQIYNLLQLMLREYVGSMKLDDLLRKKKEIGDFVLENLKQKSDIFGIEFLFAGLKDIILPGEIKTILNTVLLAEKNAQATIITRREETASTRSLLNTAKLMEENKTLYRLKELEVIEKICDKIGNISLMGGGSLIEHLSALFAPKIEDKK